jgi:hypothetical protein
LPPWQARTKARKASYLAGKYKSVQDLEQAYKELQTKLSRGESVAPEAEDDSTADDQADGNDKEDDDKPADNAREIYGDFIGGKFEEAGIDFQDMNVRWQQTGTLESGDYDQLAEAGFNRDMVDAYLSGLQYKRRKTQRCRSRRWHPSRSPLVVRPSTTR